MFEGASSFNQPIGDWNTHSGEWFVSNDQGDSNVHSSCSVSNSDEESIHHGYVAFEGASSLNQLLFPFFQQAMFDRASTFNQPIGNWKVSSGTNFVSNDQIVRFDSIRPLVLLCFHFGFRHNPSWCAFGRKRSQQIVFCIVFPC
jgi:hypothetical protein